MNVLWLIYCLMRLPYGKRKFFRPPEIEIVDLLDPEIVMEVVEGARIALFTEFVKRRILDREWMMDEIRKNPPEFDFVREGPERR